MILKTTAGSADFTNYPLIVLETTSSYESWDDVEKLFDSMDRMISAYKGPYIMKCYTLDKFIGGEDRVKVGRIINNMTDKYRNRIKGSVVVQKNLIGRIMAKGAMLLVKSPAPTVFVATEEEADKWVKENLLELSKGATLQL